MPGPLTEQEREEFLAEPRVGVVSVASEGERPPTTSGRPRSSLPRRCSTTAVQASSKRGAGAGERRPATR